MRTRTLCFCIIILIGTWRKASPLKWPCLQERLTNKKFVDNLGTIQRILTPCASNAPTLNLNASKNVLKKDVHLGRWFYAIWWFWWYYLSRQVTFHLVQKSGPDVNTTIYEKGSMFNKAFDRSKPTKIVIHGFGADKDSAIGRFMRLAYFNNKTKKSANVNLVIVNWDNISKQRYIVAMKKLIVVAAQVERFITKLVFEYGVKLSSIHIIGHSLGAHVAGITGTLVSRHAWTAAKWSITHKEGGKIGRVTGLDPALPGFKKLGKELKIGKNAADFVDIMHTSSYIFGLSETLGHADFYVNSGLPQQPGCGLSGVFGVGLGLFSLGCVCSHSRAYYYYAESIVFPKAFLARKCPRMTYFKLGSCNKNPVVYMGEATPHTAYHRWEKRVLEPALSFNEFPKKCTNCKGSNWKANF